MSVVEEMAALSAAWQEVKPIVMRWAAYQTRDNLKSQLTPAGDGTCDWTPFEAASAVVAAIEGWVPMGKHRGVEDRLRAALKVGVLQKSEEYFDLDNLRDLVVLDVHRQIKAARNV